MKLMRANTFSKLEKMVKDLEYKGYRQVARLYSEQESLYYLDSNSTKVDLDTEIIEYNGNYVALEKQSNDTLDALKHVFG